MKKKDVGTFLLNDLIQRIERMSQAELRRRVRKADEAYRRSIGGSGPNGRQHPQAAICPHFSHEQLPLKDGYFEFNMCTCGGRPGKRASVR